MNYRKPHGHSVRAGVLIATAAIMAAGCSAETHNPLGESFNSTAQRPLLVDLDGNEFDVLPDSTRPATVVVFTRSDCPVSNRHAPDVRQLYERFHPRGVEFYLIYVDPSEDPDAIRKHLVNYKYPCTALRDAGYRFAAACGATRTPETVVFDRSRRAVYRGRINDLYAGLGDARPTPTRHDLADAIEATLAGQPVAQAVTEAVGCPIGDL